MFRKSLFGQLWLFVRGLRSFAGSLLLFAGGLLLLASGLWSFACGLWSFSGGLWSFGGGLSSFVLACSGLWSLPVLVTTTGKILLIIFYILIQLDIWARLMTVSAVTNILSILVFCFVLQK